jgi:tripartite-type tricarboxylate transporter receptor subunit TctC
MQRVRRALLSLALLAPVLAAAQSAAWPAKPLHFVVAFAPAGPADIIARLLGQKLGEALGQGIVVENKPGAGGSVASALVARAEPDGYTLMVNTSSYAVNPSLQRSLGFDAEKDLVLASLVASSPNLIVTGPAVKARTLKEVMAEAAGGQWNYATAGAGTTPHLTAEYLFKVLGKVKVTHVPYQGGGPALAAAMGGQTQLASVALPAAVELVKSGRVHGIAVTGARRSPALPEVPTVAESGYPGFEDVTWVGVFAPARTPEDILQRLNREIAAIQRDPEFQARLAAAGFEPMAGSLAESREYLRAEIVKWSRVVRETGAKAD